MNEDKTASLSVIGIPSDPNVPRDDWDDDFDFDDDRAEPVPTIKESGPDSNWDRDFDLDACADPDDEITSIDIKPLFQEEAAQSELLKVPQVRTPSSDRVPSDPATLVAVKLLKDFLLSLPALEFVEKDVEEPGRRQTSPFELMRDLRKDCTEFPQDNGDLEKQIEMQEWKIAHSVESKDSMEESKERQQMARFLLAEKSFSAAVEHAEAAVLALEEFDRRRGHNSLIRVDAYVLLGEAQTRDGNFNAAASSFRTALAIAEVAALPAQVAAIHHHLGKVLPAANAVQHFIHHLKFHSSAREGDQWSELAKGCFELGRCACEMIAMDIAVSYLRKALAASSKAPEHRDMRAIQQNASTMLRSALTNLTDGSHRFQRKPSSKKLEAEVDEEEEDWDVDVDKGGKAVVTGARLGDSLPPLPAGVKDVRNLGDMKVRASPKNRSKSFGNWSARGGPKRMLKLLWRPRQSDRLETLEDGKTLPRRYRLLFQLDDKSTHVNVITYPKPTMLQTVRTKDGHRLLSETNLEMWLTTLISRHQHAYATLVALPDIHKLMSAAALPPHTKDVAHVYLVWFPTQLHLVSKGSRQWGQLYCEHCTRLYASRNYATCWTLLLDYFTNLPHVASSSPPHHPHMDDREQAALFRLSLALLRIAAKLRVPERKAAFQDMLTAVLRLTRSHQPLVALLEVECAAHHALVEAAEAPVPSSLMESLYRLYTHASAGSSWSAAQSGGLPFNRSPTLPNHPSSHSPTHTPTKMASSLSSGNLVGQYGTSGMLPEMPQPLECVLMGELNAAEVAALALADMYLVTNRWSPLHISRPSASASEVDHAMLYHTNSMDSPRSSPPTSHDSSAFLIDQATHMQLLHELYLKLPYAFYAKAKVAFVLGLHSLNDLDKPQQAEQWFFEALYMLDLSESLVPGGAPCVSQLGLTALTMYGDVLLTNHKYRYAVLAYEAAIACHKLRTCTDMHQLNRKLALICKENHDWTRALIYYLKILQKAKDDNNVNEFVYVSETVSSMHLERGDFRSAEDYLTAAGLFLRGAAASTPAVAQNSGRPDARVDSHYLQLELKRADVYLHSNRIDDCITLAERLAQMDLPIAKKAALLTLAAQAYLKKRWFVECLATLTRLRNEVLRGCEDDKGKRGAERVTSLGSGSLDACCGAKHKLLMASNYYHAAKYPDALRWTELALEDVPANNIRLRGRLYYLRGKVLAEVCRTSTLVDFPTALVAPTPATEPEPIHRVLSLDDISLSMFRCTGDVVRECVNTFRKAYEYFRVLGDDIRVAHTACRIAQVYLEHLFVPVVLLHQPLDHVSRLASAPSHMSEPIAGRSQRHHHRDGEDAQGGQDVVISLELVEQSATLALEVAADISDVLLMLSSLMNMAELRHLQGKTATAVAYWAECRDLFFGLFTDGATIAVSHPPRLLERLLSILRRLTRFLVSLDPEFIKKHLHVLHAYLNLQLQYDRSLRAPRPPPKDAQLASPRGKQWVTLGRSSISYVAPSQHMLRSVVDKSYSTYPPSGLGPTKKDARAPVFSLFESAVPPDHGGGERGSSTRSSAPCVLGGQADGQWSAQRLGEVAWSCVYRIRTQNELCSTAQLSHHELLAQNQMAISKLMHAVKDARARGFAAPPSGPPPLTAAATVASRSSQLSHRTMSAFGSLSAAFLSLRTSPPLEPTPKTPKPTSHPPSPPRSPSATTAPSSPRDTDASNARSPMTVLILHIADLIVYFVPALPSKRIHRFGGRDPSPPFNTPPSTAPSAFGLGTVLSPSDRITVELRRYLLDLLVRPRNVFTEKQALLDAALVNDLGERLFASPRTLTRAEEEGSSSDVFVELSELKRSLSEDGISLHTSSSACMDEDTSSSGISRLGSTLSAPGVVGSPTRVPCFSVSPTVYSPSTPVHKVTLSPTLPQPVWTSTLEPPPVSQPSCAPIRWDQPQAPERSAAQPLLVLCSPSLLIIPWELLFDQVVLRSFSSLPPSHSLRPSRKNSPRDLAPSGAVIPKYISFFASPSTAAHQPAASRAAEDAQRNEFLLHRTLAALHISHDQPVLSHATALFLPFTSPLIKHGRTASSYKRKYRRFIFIDVTKISEQPSEVLTILDSQVVKQEHALLVMTTGDLVNYPDVMHTILTTRPDSTFFFVPPSMTKFVVRYLLKAQDDAARSAWPGACQFLFSAATVLQKQYKVPVVVVNLDPPP